MKEGIASQRRFKRVVAEDCWPKTSDKEDTALLCLTQEKEGVREWEQMQRLVLLHGAPVCQAACFTSVAVPSAQGTTIGRRV